ncbi:MAG: 4-phosphopantetheinyl transferase family protein, partial [Kordiimonadaceae bacterium]|nr:4-phosphopantetheinyl transferase family protein [Kordiimonadaceae bacterium]
SEWALLSAMPEEAARTLFFTLWAIKESFVKMENGALMPYLSGIELDLSDGMPKLAKPTPGGVTDAFIHFHFIPEFELIVALVSEKTIELVIDSDIQLNARRADPFANNAVETGEDAA